MTDVSTTLAAISSLLVAVSALVVSVGVFYLTARIGRAVENIMGRDDS